MSDITYIAGRPMTMGDHDVQPGDEIDGSQIPYLEAFISSGYVYAITPEKGYDRLPPHLFSKFNTLEEAEVKIFSPDNGVTHVESAAGQEAFEESEVKRRAEAQATVSQGRNSAAAQAKAAAYLASQKSGRKTKE